MEVAWDHRIRQFLVRPLSLAVSAAGPDFKHGVEMIEFTRRILFVGFGSVAQCALPILVKHFRVPLQNITVMDLEDKSAAMQPWTERGVNWVRDQVTPENLGELLGQYLSPGDLLIDLAWNIDCCEIVQWCHDHGVLYINTSVEVWDPYAGGEDKHPTERTLYWRHMNLRRALMGALVYTTTC